MGKSPGRWIKAVLFGKKHSKSRQLKNATPEKKTSFRTTGENPVEDSPVISAPQQLTENGTKNTGIEVDLPGVLCSTASGIAESSETQASSVPVSDAEKERQNHAAAIVQATFKGYVARRAFRALKGIIRLQALIRGHLVRRQAAATLYCMYGIVKLQAVVRGRNVRLADATQKSLKKYKFRELQVNVGAKSSFSIEKLAANSYIRKLLGSVAPAMPLTLQYERSAPNSSANWLDRWSVSRFWVPPARPSKAAIMTTHRKQIENDIVKSKRTFRRAESGANGDNGLPASLEINSKKIPKKGYSHHSVLVQEQAENELERVKRSLRKVSETVTEKPKQQLSAKTAPRPVDKAEKILNPVSKPNGAEAASKIEADDLSQKDLYPIDANVAESLEPPLSQESSPKQDRIIEDKRRANKERRSLPAKPEAMETVAQNTLPSLPSYMAATESAKAKLRASGSSKFREDGAGPGHVRRHSLPSSLNSKFTNSLSPRIQQPNGKGGSNKSSVSVLSSRDDKVVQPGWKR